MTPPNPRAKRPAESIEDKVARHVSGLPRSGIRDFFDIVQSMEDVISLGIGEPDFVTPWHIREASIYALEKGRTSYTSNLGALGLRREIAKYLDRHFHLAYDPAEEIIVTTGVSEAIDLALRALVNPGDEVLYHEPCYVSYNPCIVLAGGVPVAVPTRAEEGFSLKAEAIEKKITPKSKLLMLNFPTNPTGAVLKDKDLKEVAELCLNHDLLVLSDEIYGELTYEGKHKSIAELPGMKERTIFLHGFSKAFAMTGYRIGYACAPHVLTEAMMKVHQYTMLCASSISQEAAREAFANGDADVLEMWEQYRARRNFVVHHFNRLGLTCAEPQGAFYAFPSIRETGLSSTEFALQLLKTEKVAVVPGSAFGSGGEGYVRCSYATGMDQLESAVERIERFLQART